MSQSQTIFQNNKNIAGLAYNTSTGFVGDFFVERGQALVKIALRSTGEVYAGSLDALTSVAVGGTSLGGVTGSHIKSSLSAIIPAGKDIILKLLEDLREKGIIDSEEVVKAKLDLHLTQQHQFRETESASTAAYL